MEPLTTHDYFLPLTVGGETVGHLEVDAEQTCGGWIQGILHPNQHFDRWWPLFNQVTRWRQEAQTIREIQGDACRGADYAMHEAEKLEGNATAKLCRNEILLDGQPLRLIELRENRVMAFVQRVAPEAEPGAAADRGRM